VQTPDARERFMLASFGQTRCAISLGQIERVIRGPRVQRWPGNGSVQGIVRAEGWLVWLLSPGQVFPELIRGQGAGDWLLVLKATSGLTRVGVLADAVSGPVANLSLGKVKILHHKRVEDLDEFSA
jgi:chemotaxis signal transduction protein